MGYLILSKSNLFFASRLLWNRIHVEA